jgi:hypothetical protein
VAEAGPPDMRRAADAASPPFEALASAHRAAAEKYRRLAIGLVVAGALVGLAGLAMAWHGTATIGLILAATAAIPWKKGLEHRERAEGVEILGEEWRDAAAPPQRRERLRQLIHELYA